MEHFVAPRRILAALALCALLAACGKQAQFDRNQRAIDDSIATNGTDAHAPAGSK
jgi:uncharacterized lipoprotein